MATKADQATFDWLRNKGPEGYGGVYRGIVESIDDPDRLGRCKVRVWAIHGNENLYPFNALPWAEVAEKGGGGYDYGEFNPPPVGSHCFVMFENGVMDFPIIVGTSRGRPLRDDNNPNVFLVKSGQPASEKPWLPPDGELETPKEVFEDVFAGDPHPTRRVWQKSYKGHTIYIEDGDGAEFIRIVDRAGQIIEMDCPVDATLQAGNKIQRGTRNADRGDQLSHDVMVNRSAKIRLKDLSGQEIVLDATDSDESITVRSKCRQTNSEQTVTLKSGKGKECVELRDSGGNFFKLDPNSYYPVQIQDATGNSIIFDKDRGFVTIKGTKGVENRYKKMSTIVDGELKEEVGGDRNTIVNGNLKTTVGNALSLSVAAGGEVNVTGATNLTFVNAPLDGIPVEVPVIAKVVLGGLLIKCTDSPDIDGAPMLPPLDMPMTLKTKQGDIEYSTEKGAVNINTSEGDLTVATIKGKAVYGSMDGAVDVATRKGAMTVVTSDGALSVTTQKGDAVLGSELGKTALIGTISTHLGSNTAANPIPKGIELLAALNALASGLAEVGSAFLVDVPGGKAVAAVGTALQGLLAAINSTKVFTD